jgi:sterol desaturase/sphingolipid hydroxylase (fatty acid hydroxylase superfamily)
MVSFGPVTATAAFGVWLSEDLLMAPARTERIRRLGSSRFNYWFGYVANVTLILWMGSPAIRDGRLALGWGQLIFFAVAGLYTWTLAEYLLHRYLYHVLPSFLSEGHDLHHHSPRALIGVPWYLTTIAMVGLFLVLSRLLNPASVGVMLASCWTGYVFYCLIHHGSHHWNFRNRWLRRMRRHHLIHHAHPTTNWGFTTALWDHVFGTAYVRGGVRVTSVEGRSNGGERFSIIPPATE